MIEINLLPQQYRAVERTPLPVFVGLIAAIILVGLSIGMFARVFQQTNTLRVRKDEVNAELKRAREQEAEYNDLVARMNESQKRVDTVFAIAESKIPWSIKLEQLVEIVPPEFWVDRIGFERRPDGTGEMKLAVNARGTALKLSREFINALRANTNFFYHFETVLVPRVEARDNRSAEFLEPKHLAFDVTLPLRRTEVGAAPKK